MKLHLKDMSNHPCVSEIKSTYKANPARRRKMAMSGNVVSRRFRRPKVSIVQTAGKAMTKLRAPNPQEARRAWMLLKPD